MRLIAPALVLLLAAPAFAKPPESRGFMRMDDLRVALATKQEKLRELEEFRKKPLVEKYLIKFMQGEKKFEKFDLTAEKVVKEILKWDALDVATPDAAAARVLEMLPQALKQRFDVIPIPRKERFKASRPLVDALMHERIHVRKAAFDALRLMYRNQNGYFYRPDATKKQRKEKQKSWSDHIKRESRR